ncbi:MAG: hypothetical protein HPY66_0505 [Firmicutes bacterium]|nr:hypothetical protein [Bacillota bacterium]MDI6704938.1 hypothetical protein [Bacillota bacterium]
MYNKIAIAVIAIVIILFITNPGGGYLANWIMEGGQYEIEDEVLRSYLQKEIIQYVFYDKGNVERENHYLFSIYKIRLEDGEIYRILGIFNSFEPLGNLEK